MNGGIEYKFQYIISMPFLPPKWFVLYSVYSAFLSICANIDTYATIKMETFPLYQRVPFASSPSCLLFFPLLDPRTLWHHFSHCRWVLPFFRLLWMSFAFSGISLKGTTECKLYVCLSQHKVSEVYPYANAYILDSFFFFFWFILEESLVSFCHSLLSLP